jgi:hypothetical protein
MNDEAVKFVAWLEKAATIRTPVGSAYAIALALMHVAAQLEKIAANTEKTKGVMLYGEEPKRK